jgi:quinol monooxygenase YgiN
VSFTTFGERAEDLPFRSEAVNPASRAEAGGRQPTRRKLDAGKPRPRENGENDVIADRGAAAAPPPTLSRGPRGSFARFAPGRQSVGRNQQAWIIGQGGMAMSKLEVSARMTVRKGKLEEFKQQAAECIRLTKEKDTKTLRYDWFLSRDETECEIRETYEGSEGLVEHRKHIGEALSKLFSEFADNHTVMVYGNPSPKLMEMAKRMPQGSVKWYSFLQGLGS